MDSGAFQDTEKGKRLSVEEALKKQMDFESRLGRVSHRIVAYDYIGDREQTMVANRYLASQRDRLHPRQIVLMVQGQTIEEYIRCLKEVIDIAQVGDCIGYGGVAVSGRNRTVRRKLVEAVMIGFPAIYSKGIRDIHIFGVGTFGVLQEVSDAIKILRMLYPMEDLSVSCDTSSFEVGAVMGRVVDVENKTVIYTYTASQKLTDYHPAELALSNIQKAKQVISTF